jgi:pimeloyl-ACP methyl ester carboxylesterase
MMIQEEIAPACSQRLVLADAVAAWRREARHGELDTGRYRCRYFTWGEGPPLLLIPGLCSDGPTFVPLMSRLRQHFRCIGYDLPTGVNDGARWPSYSHDGLVEDLFALLDHLQVRSCCVHGFSFGSTLALAALIAQPHRFERAVLQGGFAWRRLAPLEVFATYWARYLPGTLAQIPLLGWLTHHLEYEAFRGRNPEDWRFFLDSQEKTPVKAFAQRALLMHALDLRARLSTIAHPLLLVSGDRDPLVARCCQDVLCAGLKRVAEVELENCGHHPHLSHPEVLAEIESRFLLSK